MELTRENDPLASLRREVSQVDEKLVPLLLKRLELVQELGKKKRDHKLDVEDQRREREVLKLVQKLSDGASMMSQQSLLVIYRNIVETSKLLQTSGERT